MKYVLSFVSVLMLVGGVSAYAADEELQPRQVAPVKPEVNITTTNKTGRVEAKSGSNKTDVHVGGAKNTMTANPTINIHINNNMQSAGGGCSGPTCRPAIRPAPVQRRRLTCCPPGMFIPGLPPCPSRRPVASNCGGASPCGGDPWERISSCLAGLGLGPGEYFSTIGPDGLPHAMLTQRTAARLIATGQIEGAKLCVNSGA